MQDTLIEFTVHDAWGAAEKINRKVLDALALI